MNCSVWGKRAQTAAEYLRKGAKITITGRAKLNSYTNQEGVERVSLNVDVADFTLPAREANPMDAEVPF